MFGIKVKVLYIKIIKNVFFQAYTIFPSGRFCFQYFFVFKKNISIVFAKQKRNRYYRHKPSILTCISTYFELIIEWVNHLFFVLGRSTTTSREVNETKGAHTCSRPRAFEEKKNEKKKKKTWKNPSHPKHTTISTAARRPRPPWDGARRNPSNVLAHSRTLP